MQNQDRLGRRKRVVLATIDRRMEETLGQKFSDLEYDFFCVQRSMDTVMDLLNRELDLLILDMDLCGGISIDLLPVVRKLRPCLPVVLISDDLTHSMRRIAAEQGVTFHTGKPNDPEDLGSIVYAAEKIIAKHYCLPVN